MKREYIAIALFATVVVVLLSGCTSAPSGYNATAIPNTVVNKTMEGASDLATGAGAAAAPAAAGATDPTLISTPWPDLLSGNNTSILNTSQGMREVVTNQSGGIVSQPAPI